MCGALKVEMWEPKSLPHFPHTTTCFGSQVQIPQSSLCAMWKRCSVCDNMHSIPSPHRSLIRCTGTAGLTVLSHWSLVKIIKYFCFQYFQAVVLPWQGVEMGNLQELLQPNSFHGSVIPRKTWTAHAHLCPCLLYYSRLHWTGISTEGNSRRQYQVSDISEGVPGLERLICLLDTAYHHREIVRKEKKGLQCRSSHVFNSSKMGWKIAPR